MFGTSVFKENALTNLKMKQKLHNMLCSQLGEDHVNRRSVR